MSEQEPQPTVQQALVAVMRDVRAVGKDDRNTQQGFNFRGIDATLNSVGPALRDNGVAMLPSLVEQATDIAYTGKNENKMHWVRVTVDYTFLGPGGDTLTSRVPGEAMDTGDKAYSKAMSVALRTCLLQTLALPTQERDPDADSYEHTATPVGPPGEASEAEVALTQLTRVMSQQGLDAGAVVREYVSRYGVDPRKDENADNLHEYVQKLRRSGGPSAPAEPAQPAEPAEPAQPAEPEQAGQAA